MIYQIYTPYGEPEEAPIAIPFAEYTPVLRRGDEFLLPADRLEADSPGEAVYRYLDSF